MSGQLSSNVLDCVTGETADVDRIASEEWANGLVYTNISGFALMQDGALILTDECGKFVYCPPDRFEDVSVAGAGIRR